MGWKPVFYNGVYIYIDFIHVLWYTYSMKDRYKRTATTVSFIRYHFVFCPRFRRKIFLIPGVEERFKELTAEVCQENDIEILAMECQIDHVHLFVSAYPQPSIPEIMKIIKGATSHRLRDEFTKLEKMPSLWTRSYFVSTAGLVSAETIQQYVETQKKRS